MRKTNRKLVSELLLEFEGRIGRLILLKKNVAVEIL